LIIPLITRTDKAIYSPNLCKRHNEQGSILNPNSKIQAKIKLVVIIAINKYSLLSITNFFILTTLKKSSLREDIIISILK
jgi:hypothetical protein